MNNNGDAPAIFTRPDMASLPKIPSCAQFGSQLSFYRSDQGKSLVERCNLRGLDRLHTNDLGT